MIEIVVFENLSLDGVMQAPGRPDEDTRDGFEHGGWAVPYTAMSEAGDIGEYDGLLLGRRTYEDFYGFWPNQTNNPFTTILNNMQKYVPSTTLEEPLPWSNSTLLKGDIIGEIKRLKAELEMNLLVMGSGNLIQTLMQHDLVDRYVLLIHPLVLGSGRQLFPHQGVSTKLKLVDSKTTSTGVVIGTYQPTEPAASTNG